MGRLAVIQHEVNAGIFQSAQMCECVFLIVMKNERFPLLLRVFPDALQLQDIIMREIGKERQVLKGIAQLHARSSLESVLQLHFPFIKFYCKRDSVVASERRTRDTFEASR